MFVLFLISFIIFPWNIAHAVAAYYADAVAGGDDDSRFDNVQFDSKLGLAVEGLQDGLTMEQLWRVV